MKHKNKIVSLFHLAVTRGNPQLIKAMLNNDAISIGEMNIELHNAIASGDKTIVNLLLDNLKDPSQRLKLDKHLFQAIRLGYEHIVQLLLHHGANPSAVDRRNHAALKIAIQYQNKTIVNYLLQSGADLDYIDPYGNSIAMLAASYPSTEILQAVLQYGAKTEFSITCAVRHNFYNQVRLLLLHGTNVNEANNKGITPLITSILHGNIQIIKLLIQFGANPDWQDINGNTALMYAARHSRSELFRMLVGLGSSTNIKNNQGETAYDILIKRFRTSNEIK